MKQIAKFILPYWRKGILPIFFLLISTAISFFFPMFPKWAIDEIITGRKVELLPWLAGIFLAMIVLQRLFSYLNEITFFKFQKDSILDIQKRLTRRVFYYPMEFFDKNHSGYLMGRIHGDVAGLSFIFSHSMVMVLMDAVKFTAVLFILLSMNVKLTLYSMILLPLLLVKIFVSRDNIKEVNSKILEENAKLQKEMSDTLQGVEVLKSFSREEEGIARMETGLGEFQKVEVERNLIHARYRSIVDIMVHTGEVFLLYFGMQAILAGELTIGSYVAFSGYILFIYGPVQNLSTTFVWLDYAKRSYDRIKELLDILPEDNGERQLESIEHIEAKQLEFAYEGKDTIINNLNLSIKRGEKVLLEGESGSGKSTLLKLLLGLYRPKSGKIFYNGIELAEVDLKKLREKVGYISQSVFLFNKTIKENIVFNRTDITDSELEQLLEKCKLSGRVNEFKDGLYEVISEKGVNFSGGEKQRLALARALVKDPEIIIIDEGTSNLDIDTEKEILATIDEAFKDKIIIRITHREVTEPGWKRIKLNQPRLEAPTETPA